MAVIDEGSQTTTKTIDWSSFYSQGALPQSPAYVAPAPTYNVQAIQSTPTPQPAQTASPSYVRRPVEPVAPAPAPSPIELAGPLSWTAPTIPQPSRFVAPPTDFYSQGGLPQATTPTDAPSSWTDAELDMLGGMDVQQAINWGANYTGQALFGGWDTRTNEPFTGAFDRTTGELVNPNLMPSLLSPEFATALGISDEQRVMLGYNPDYPYELLQPASGTGDGGDSGYSYAPSGGGYSPSRGYGYSPSSTLINWRIGF